MDGRPPRLEGSVATDAWFRESPSARFEEPSYFWHCHRLARALEVEISRSFWTWGLWRGNQIQTPGLRTQRLC